MVQRTLKFLLVTILFGTAAWPVQAQMSTDPLLSHTASVESNIVYIFDSSGSMGPSGGNTTYGTYLYQYGSPDTSGLGIQAPETTYSPYSPDVNLLYYDPRKTYSPRINADGTYKPAGPTSAIPSFKVYFFNPGTTNTYGVASVNVSTHGSGYPASGVTATIGTPASGTQATASVTMASYQSVQSVTMNSKGSGYPTNCTGVTVAFQAAPVGNTTATGTVNCGTSSKVNTLAVAAGGSGYPASGVTASFTPAPGAGGVPATATVTTASTKTVSSVNVTAMGSNYPVTGKTVSFTAPPAGGVRATGTVTTAMYYYVTGITINTAGSGYPSGVGVTFSAPQIGTDIATATVTRTSSGSGRGIASINITNTGSGYTSPPTMTFTGTAPSTAATFTVNTSTSTGIAGITITNPGSGYTSTPTATLGGTSAGSGAALTVVTGTTYVVSAVNLTNGGSGYAGTPILVLANAGSGAGAAFNVVMGTANVITGVTIVNSGSGYASTPTVTISSNTGSGASGTANTTTSYGVASVTVGSAGSGYTSAPLVTFSTTSGSGANATAILSAAPTGTIGGNKKWGGTPASLGSSTFFTPSYLPDAGSPLAVGATATLVYPNSAIATANTTGIFPKFNKRTDCGATSCSWAQELQNYANWKTYHSNRLDLAKTGIGMAFQGLNPSFRLGWGTIHNIDNSNQLDAGVRLFVDCDNTNPAKLCPSNVSGGPYTTQTDFFTWLYGLSANGDTPNRIALNKVGSYYSRVDDSGPWANYPPKGVASTNSPGSPEVLTHASCRRSYALLMTDGYYNDSFTLADKDTSTLPAITTPNTYQYTPTGPYSDTANGTKIANTMADVAMKYWATDLRPNIANNVKPSATDPAFWQHMNFYAIDLGLIGTPAYDSNNPAVLAALTGDSTTRTLNWQTPSTNDPSAIDDMWHATINGRGTISTANDAADLRDAIGHMLTDVSGATGDQAGVAVSTGVEYSDTTNKFTPQYDRSKWTGLLASKNVATDATLWQVETLCSDGPNPPNTGSKCPIAEKPYIDLIPSANCAGAYGAGCRNIYVGNGATSGTPRAVPFTYSGMGSSLTNSMTATTSIPITSALISYLRGDYANESLSINSAVSSATYRVRPNKLGDIVNSTPTYVGSGSLDGLYDQLPSGTAGQSSYAAFRTGKNSAAEGLLLVGANDGMLHAFRNGKGSSQAGGIETFAYVPNALLPTLNQLADPLYVHRYYVDGPMVQTDAYVATPAVSSSGWASIVLGSTGDGAGVASSNGHSPGTSVFAIETTSVFNQGITDSNNVPYMNASSVLWEISSATPGFSELGYMMNKIQAGTTTDGSWIAVFGNGYESASCKAQLFVVNLATGALIKKIDTNVGSGNCTSASNANRNGLGGVGLVRNDKQQIIGAYAGDLQGNLWKFNLSGSSSSWGVDLGGAPLFQAGSSKPIFDAPSVITLPVVPATVPATSPDHGQMVVFGTGKLFETSDLTTTSIQSMYGIWDTAAFGAASYTGVALTNNSLLVQQTIGAPVVGNVPGQTTQDTYYPLTNNVVCYVSNVNNCPTAPAGTTAVLANRRGWQTDLPGTGERMTYPVKIQQPHEAVAQSISPTGVSSQDPCTAVAAGNSVTYVFDPLSGARVPFQPFDTNGDGVIDGADLTGLGGKGGGQTSESQILNSKDTSGCSSIQYDAKPTCPASSKLTAHPMKSMIVNGLTVGTTMICSVTYTCDASAARVQTRQWRQLFMR